jgi:hypothetical protein
LATSMTSAPRSAASSASATPRPRWSARTTSASSHGADSRDGDQIRVPRTPADEGDAADSTGGVRRTQSRRRDVPRPGRSSTGTPWVRPGQRLVSRFVLRTGGHAHQADMRVAIRHPTATGTAPWSRSSSAATAASGPSTTNTGTPVSTRLMGPQSSPLLKPELQGLLAALPLLVEQLQAVSLEIPSATVGRDHLLELRGPVVPCGRRSNAPAPRSSPAGRWRHPGTRPSGRRWSRRWS